VQPPQPLADQQAWGKTASRVAAAKPMLLGVDEHPLAQVWQPSPVKPEPVAAGPATSSIGLFAAATHEVLGMQLAHEASVGTGKPLSASAMQQRDRMIQHLIVYAYVGYLCLHGSVRQVLCLLTAAGRYKCSASPAVSSC
jgi:hypothetical protein